MNTIIKKPLLSCIGFIIAAVIAMVICCHGEGYSADSAVAQCTDIEDDETLFFFPGFMYHDAAGTNWNIAVHGWVYEPEHDSRKRRLLMSLVSKALGFSEADAGNALLRERLRHFMVDQDGGSNVSIRIGNTNYFLGTCGRNGHVMKTLKISGGDIPLQGKEQLPFPRMEFSSRSCGKNPRIFHGAIKQLPRRGVFVVSDIDDTIKISRVTDKKALIQNTFLRPYREVPGMSALYRAWERKGAVFHYLTASPWQLYWPLEEFRKNKNFPEGFFHMKMFGVPFNFTKLFESSDTVKLPYLQMLFSAFPEYRFILVGDSGEMDPEVYGTIARRYPEKIIKILIRNIGNEIDSSPRMREAFKGVPRSRWVLFNSPEHIIPTIMF
ncbi:MAG TPA: DUF2183 domain-containing protein [Spirochaetota bacterium]|nr:DUF2183 domain-containing protein [Spirochaetota bacterium]